MAPSPFASLFDRASFDAELAKLHARWLSRGRLERLASRGLSLGDVGPSAPELTAVLTRTLARGEFRFEPLERVVAAVDGKQRVLFVPGLVDALVLGVLAEILAALITPVLSPHVYSYQRGRSPWDAVRDISKYLARHRALTPLRSRGLYGVKRDVSQYGESIRTEPGAPLWEQLEAVLAPHRSARGAELFERLLREAIRPEVRDATGVVRRLELGTPTGSPIQPALNNLHLTELDRALVQIPGGFYARFGDDFVFLHPEPVEAERASELIDQECARLGLGIRAAKRQDFYFTGPGRPSGEAPQFKPVRHFEYVGARIDFLGRIGMKRAKAQAFLRRMRQRVGQAKRLLGPEAPPEALEQLLVEVARRALAPHHVLADPAAQLLRYVVDDREQLKQLDYLLALLLAEVMSGRRGARAFRDCPWKRLRQRGLLSLVQARNTGESADPEGPPPGAFAAPLETLASTPMRDDVMGEA
jgi:hypothetical protein